MSLVGHFCYTGNFGSILKAGDELSVSPGMDEASELLRVSEMIPRQGLVSRPTRQQSGKVEGGLRKKQGLPTSSDAAAEAGTLRLPFDNMRYELQR